uniref:Protein phosphatase 1 regulatory subunit 12C n=1 Tax=Sphenodon punctatus TaxID=8508 RepID=A0A8D0GAQ6_SPHPU
MAAAAGSPGAGGALSDGARARRREQLRSWAEAEAGRAEPGPERGPGRVRFEAAAEFLACCAGAELGAARGMLRADPAAVNGANADGISALHQLEFSALMMKGWSPLTSPPLPRFLLDHGANIAAVNSDGDVPLDIAEADAMETVLRAEIARRGVDVEAAKREEEEVMLRDARQWLNAGKITDENHPKTGASALHVAAAKGYIEVMRLLLQAGYEANVQDRDGWTPLHAAAHWGVEEACRLLAEHLCDMEALNNMTEHWVGWGIGLSLGTRALGPCSAPLDADASLALTSHQLRSKKEAHLKQAVIDTSMDQQPSYSSKHRR